MKRREFFFNFTSLSCFFLLLLRAAFSSASSSHFSFSYLFISFPLFFFLIFSNLTHQLKRYCSSDDHTNSNSFFQKRQSAFAHLRSKMKFSFNELTFVLSHSSFQTLNSFFHAVRSSKLIMFPPHTTTTTFLRSVVMFRSSGRL